MSQTNIKEKTYLVEDVFNHSLSKAIYKEILSTRRCSGEDKFSYDTIEKSHENVTYLIMPRHIPLVESMSFGNSNCNSCYGSGKIIMNVGKDKIENTDDFMMLASIPLKGLTEEQKKIVIEKEKKAKFWRVVLPCRCTIKSMLKKGMQIISNDMNNIVIELTCTEKATE